MWLRYYGFSSCSYGVGQIVTLDTLIPATSVMKPLSADIMNVTPLPNDLLMYILFSISCSLDILSVLNTVANFKTFMSVFLFVLVKFYFSVLTFCEPY